MRLPNSSRPWPSSGAAVGPVGEAEAPPTLEGMTSSSTKSSELDLHMGHDELVIRDRYEVLGILDDLLIAGFFIVGSILFFNEETATAGTWLFLLGSIMMLIRPMIALTRRVHLRRLHPDRPITPSAAVTNE